MKLKYKFIAILIFFYFSIREQAEIDSNEELINERKKQLRQVEKILIDVHGFARDIAFELKD